MTREVRVKDFHASVWHLKFACYTLTLWGLTLFHGTLVWRHGVPCFELGSGELNLV